MSVFYRFLMQALNWSLCPVTAISWLTLYFQLASKKKRSDVMEPQFPQNIFLQMTRVGLSPGNPADTQFAVSAVAVFMSCNVSALYLSFWTYVCFTCTLWTSSITCWLLRYSTILFNRKPLKTFQVSSIFFPLMHLFFQAANLQYEAQVLPWIWTPSCLFQGSPETPSSCVWTGWRPLRRWRVCLALRSSESFLRLTLKTSTTSRRTPTTWTCWSVSFC